jgi:hypothetical protein
VSLAASHGARLATFDEALARTLPDHVELIPDDFSTGRVTPPL